MTAENSSMIQTMAKHPLIEEKLTVDDAEFERGWIAFAPRWFNPLGAESDLPPYQRTRGKAKPDYDLEFERVEYENANGDREWYFKVPVSDCVLSTRKRRVK